MALRTEISTSIIHRTSIARLPKSWLIGAGYLALYLLLYWVTYLQPLEHTDLTPWNPNTGLAVALLLACGPQWAPLVALGIFAGETLVDVSPPPWWLLALTSSYLATVYAGAAWWLRRKNLDRPIETPAAAAWFTCVTVIASGVAAAGYVGILVGAAHVRTEQSIAGFGYFWIGEFSGIIALTPILLARVDRRALWKQLSRKPAQLALQIFGAAITLGLTFAVAATHDMRLFYPLFAPVTWIALRYGVLGAMVSFSLVQTTLAVVLALTPGSIPLFDLQFPLLSLGITALFLGALASQREIALRRMRHQDAALQRSMRFATAGQLASALAHELNQPMTALVSYVRSAELIAEQVARDDERLAGTLNKAGAEASRAAIVLRRLREFYRGEPAQLERTDAMAICMRVAVGLQERMRRSAVEFDLSHSNEVPSIMVDRTQFEIVIHNLLTNSLDAFDTFPAPASRPRRIEIAAEVRGENVLIAVDDSGPGIASELAARLFEPFVSSKTSGMGLGLSLSRTLLRHMGGDLWSESNRLGGARFVIRLSTREMPQTAL
jgi:signal transduction histidine kinase